jgi:hypothetical protein
MQCNIDTPGSLGDLRRQPQERHHDDGPRACRRPYRHVLISALNALCATRFPSERRPIRSPGMDRKFARGTCANLRRRRRRILDHRAKIDSSSEGMLEDFSLRSHLLLVDYTSRLFRDAKAVISSELTGIFKGGSSLPWPQPANAAARAAQSLRSPGRARS